MLVKNAQNLMGAVIRTIQAAEAAYMKVSTTAILILAFTELHCATEVFIFFYSCQLSFEMSA